jgi:carbamoyltransferase
MSVETFADRIVLGVNGVEQRDHDAAACLVVNGDIVAAAEQERFSRRKKSFDEPPHDAIRFCIESSGIDPGQIEAITVGWQKGNATTQTILPSEYRGDGTDLIPVYRYDHHKSHAASVYYTSPFETAAVLVVDGEGEGESASIWHATPQGLEKKLSLGVDQSLGYTYASISRYCGLGSFGAGKIMGLAPYGEPRFVETIKTIFDGIDLTSNEAYDNQDLFIDQFLAKLTLAGLPETQFISTYDPLTLRTKREPILTQVHKDMAASVQVFLEQKMLELAQKARHLTGSTHLCLAGGVSMNCVANSVIENSGIFDALFLQPACEDNGVAIGSALAHLGTKATLSTPYLGPSFSDTDIRNHLAKRKIPAVQSTDIAAEAAEMLAQGLVVGWFQGGLEYGPRALGARSILANPSIEGMQDIVNQAKRREPWRPFGPSVLAERADDLFVNAVPSPYMLRSFIVRPEWRKKLAATVHVDGSTRPQTVEQSAHPRYHDLITKFCRHTGIPAVLNTSFNDDREPIVMTPDDAIQTFYTTGLDALVIGNHIIRKRH